ncbi:MAG: signal recognition particle-docking protein FtsY [Actinomycetes bacterium]
MALFSKLFSKLRSGSISEQDWDDIERALIESDLGAGAAAEVVATAKRNRGSDSQEEVIAILTSWLSPASRALNLATERTTTILVVGVNGTGKTTSVAKLANFLTTSGKTVMVAAADTFRAGAIDQLQTWGSRLGIPVIAGAAQADPASVAFDAISQAQKTGIDILIVDTAGRLHTKSGLMDELGKIRRVIEKSSPVDEVLLVVDATTGQNGIAQSKIFAESVSVTGLIVTKMDGSASGGIALAIEHQTDLPIKFLGYGEGAADLRPFDAATYIQGLLH